MVFKQLIYFIVWVCFLLPIHSWATGNYKMVHYNSSNALPQDFCTDLLLNKQGELLIASGKGLSRFNGYSFITVFSEYVVDVNVNSVVTKSTIYYNKEDRDSLTVLCDNKLGVKQLVRVDNSKHQKYLGLDKSGHCMFMYLEEDSLKTSYISKENKFLNIFKTPSNKFYAINRVGLWQVEDNSEPKLVYAASSLYLVSDFSNQQLQLLDVDKQKVLNLDEKDFALENVPSFLPLKDVLAVAKKDSIWAFCYRNKVEYYNAKQQVIEQSISLEVPISFIRDFIIDMDYNFWIATYGNGVFHYQRQPYYAIDNAFFQRNAITDLEIYNDSMLIGTTESDLFFYNVENDEYTLKEINCKDKITSVCANRDSIWLGTENGLYTASTTNYEFKYSIRCNQHYIQEVQISDSKLLVATATNGLYCFDYKNHKSSIYNTSNLLAHNNVSGLFIDDNENIWPYLELGKIGYIDTSAKFHLLNLQLPGVKITSIHQDLSNNYWICTDGNGVIILDNEKEIINNIPTIKGQPGCLGVFDVGNAKWVMHQRGFSIFNEGFMDYSRVDYLNPSADNNNKLLPLKGKVFINNVNSIACVDTQFASRQKAVRTSGLEIFVNNVKREASSLNVKNGIYNIQIKGKLFSLSLQDRVECQHLLVKDKRDTVINVTRSPHITYNGLSSGNYYYQLKIRSVGNQWSDGSQSISFKIKDSIFRSVWFYAVILLLCLILAYIGFKYRFRQQLKITQKLNKLVNEKTQELKNSLLELESANKELEQFAYIVSHDLKAPLRGIDTLVTICQEDYEEDMTEELKDNFALIKKRVNRMNELITGILSYSKAGKESEKREDIDVLEMLKEVKDSINYNNNVTIHLPNKTFIINGNYTQLYQVVTNLIGNAVKYHDKANGNVWVSLDESSTSYIFSIKDDGPGIPEEYHEKIFEIFGTANTTSRTDSTGIGLSIVKKTIEKFGGSIKLDSAVGKGSEFIIFWPKK